MANQAKLGLESFLDDWQRMMHGARALNMPDRRIWMLWFQGEDAAPPIVKLALRSWRRHNPEWRVEVLDAQNISDWIDVSDFSADTRPAHMADVIRLRLLSRYGGVWTDATTLCLRPLDDWIEHALVDGFFAFARPQPVRSLANWFIASSSESPLTAAWRQWSEIYLLSGKPAQTYFWSHHTFDWLLRRSETLNASWQRVPSVSARGPHVFQRLLDGHLSIEDQPTRGGLMKIPLAKLNWKKGYEIYDISNLIDWHDL